MADDENVPTPETTEESGEAPAVEAVPAEPEIYIPPMPVFGRFEAKNIVIPDVGLAKYINLGPTAGVPHHGGRHANTHFAKQKISLVERLINHMMRTENWTGKKMSAYNVVKEAFFLIEEKTKENPIQVLVKALMESAPKEETTRLKYGGISVPKAVDTAPQRRLDLALRHLAQGAVQSSHRNPKPIYQCLADEIIKASKADPTSFAVAKRDDVERVAKSAR